MKSLETYIFEGLFSKSVAAGNGPDVIKKISNMQKINIPKTPEEYINYISVWTFLFYKILNVGTANDLETTVNKAVKDAYFDHLADFHLDMTNQEQEDIHYDAVNMDAISFNGYHSRWDEMIVKSGKQKNISPDQIPLYSQRHSMSDIVSMFLGISGTDIPADKAADILELLVVRYECLHKGSKYIIDSKASRAKNKRMLEKYFYEILHYVADSVELMSETPEAKAYVNSLRHAKF